jgi:hypothetical protein
MVASPIRSVFRCPLCQEHGRVVLLAAQLERDEEELLVVTELEGCCHADGFGDPVLLTFEEEWRLIEAALDAFERGTWRPYR